MWWGRDEDYLEQWGRRAGADRPTVITCVLKVLFLLDTLPEIPLLCPLPGTGRRRRSGDVPVGEPWVLDNVRTLLVKAESTELGEEAAALTAEAQEFMARRSVDAALLAAAGAVRDEPGGCRIGVDAPYETSKAPCCCAAAAAAAAAGGGRGQPVPRGVVAAAGLRHRHRVRR